jgi:hypothetical protein
LLKGILDLRITVRGDEAVLRDLQQKLTIADDDCSDLSNDIATTVYKMLIAASSTDEIEVDLHCGQTKTQIDTGGGLNVGEWYGNNPK